MKTPTLALIITLWLPTFGVVRASPPSAPPLRALKVLDLPPAKDAEAHISADGRFVARASGGKRAGLVLWDLSTKKRRWRKRFVMPKQDGQLRVLTSPDGRFVALAVFSRRRGRLWVYRAETGRRLLSDSFPRDAKKELEQLFTWCITPGNLLLARFTESLRVYDLARGRRRLTIRGCGTNADDGGGKEEGAPMIDFSQDERFVTTTHWGMSTLSVWSLKTGKLHKELKLHTCKNPPDYGCGTGSIFVGFVAGKTPLVIASGLYGAVWELQSGRRRFVFDDTVYATATKLPPLYHQLGAKLLLETSKGIVERDLRTGRVRHRPSSAGGGFIALLASQGAWRLVYKGNRPMQLSHQPTGRVFPLPDGRGRQIHGIQLIGPPGRRRPMAAGRRAVWAWPPLSELLAKPAR